MSKKSFNLINRIDPSSQQDRKLKQYYYEWKINDKNQGFTMIHENFKTSKILAEIDGGALKLYLYLSLVAKNRTGESWYSIDRLAEYFKVQSRTVDKWFKNLTDLDLVYRYRHKGRSHTTYLLPYETTSINHSLNKNVKDLEKIVIDVTADLKEFNDIYGEILSYFHLVQWRLLKTPKGEEDKLHPINFLLVITKRKNGVIIGHIYPLINALLDSGVSEQNLDTFYTFDSPLKTKAIDEPIVGIALPDLPKLNINNNKQVLINLIEQLTEVSEEELSMYEPISFGDINNFEYEIEDDIEEE